MKGRKGFTLVEIMIVVAIIALLAAIAIPNLLRARLTANESGAQATLRTISTACETFAAANDGAYPTAEADLLPATLGGTADPPYLNRAYDGLTIQGYTYTFTLGATTYSIVATAANCNSSGNNDYTIATGGVLTSAACI